MFEMDYSTPFGECSKPKKSKSSAEQVTFESDWAHLPSLVLHEIFNLLSKEDQKSASTVCKHWRQNSFHPKWWPLMKFKIEQENINKANFYTSTFGRIVCEATIVLNSLSPVCIEEFVTLLRLLNKNNHLRSIMLEPSHCRFEIPKGNIKQSCKEETSIQEIMGLLMNVLPRLEKFSIGCIEDLSLNVEDILTSLTPSKVTLLGLSSVKDDPGKYEESYFDPQLIIPFKNLQVLSIDYDQLSDVFLYNLEDAKSLERLVVHLHGIPKDHPGTSNTAWKDFKNAHPGCQLRLSVIHVYNDINSLHDVVLKKEMPLTHMKVFFCECVNMEVLHILSTFYTDSLRSLMWIDSISDSESSWIFSKPLDGSPDPLVLIAWLCCNFEELVLYGYKYLEENLIALGRLRGQKLKKLEIPEVDILFNNMPESAGEDALLDLPKSLKKPWAPIKLSELHPVIHNPVAGDSDEFLLPIVLADLY